MVKPIGLAVRGNRSRGYASAVILFAPMVGRAKPCGVANQMLSVASIAIVSIWLQFYISPWRHYRDNEFPVRKASPRRSREMKPNVAFHEPSAAAKARRKRIAAQHSQRACRELYEGIGRASRRRRENRQHRRGAGRSKVRWKPAGGVSRAIPRAGQSPFLARRSSAASASMAHA